MACQACGQLTPPTERLCLTHQQLHRGPSREAELVEAEILLNRVFPEPDTPPAGRWEIAGDDSTWVDPG